jgi:DNA-binding response OmpR family regulator/AraC-like DNA-binding protein
MRQLCTDTGAAVRPDPSALPVVLAVDDEPSVRDSLGLALEDNFQVLLAADGVQAASALATHPVDVVLLDLLMPEMHGHDVLCQMRKDHARVPVIVVSALLDVPTVVTSMKLGAWDYVTKPWQEDELLAKIRGAVRVRRDQPGVLLVSDDVASLTPLALALEPHERVLETSLAGALRSSFSAKAVILSSQAIVDDARLIHHRFPAAALVVVTDVPRSRLLESLHDIRLAAVIEPGSFGSALRELLRIGVLSDLMVPHGAVEGAIKFIAASYGARITVTEVAQAVCLSEHRLAHVFRSVTGLSVKDYILRFRVAVGRRLLTETTEKVETISSRVGFADRSNFSRTFKEIGGLPPGMFRRSQF